MPIFLATPFQEVSPDKVRDIDLVNEALEETAYYLGHITLRGTPAVQTTVRHIQMTRAQVKERLKMLKG